MEPVSDTDADALFHFIRTTEHPETVWEDAMRHFPREMEQVGPIIRGRHYSFAEMYSMSLKERSAFAGDEMEVDEMGTRLKMFFEDIRSISSSWPLEQAAPPPEEDIVEIPAGRFATSVCTCGGVEDVALLNLKRCTCWDATKAYKVILSTGDFLVTTVERLLDTKGRYYRYQFQEEYCLSFFYYPVNRHIHLNMLLLQKENGSPCFPGVRVGLQFFLQLFRDMRDARVGEGGTDISLLDEAAYRHIDIKRKIPYLLHFGLTFYELSIPGMCAMDQSKETLDPMDLEEFRKKVEFRKRVLELLAPRDCSAFLGSNEEFVQFMRNSGKDITWGGLGETMVAVLKSSGVIPMAHPVWDQIRGIIKSLTVNAQVTAAAHREYREMMKSGNAEAIADLISRKRWARNYFLKNEAPTYHRANL